ncbi:hypothetical protein NW768_009434 [Fusarium equiseti]|uniref:Uncharacterized protein n=1 Tax=Fusarium equiseti TaxID=61235 RepID=A0ABQ8R3V6_FUSEQ|nr:hypothetical protein NW768_009434 [Fusarium equiseti]
MASWLLDDSTPDCLDNGDEDSSPKKRRANTPDISSREDGPAISPLNLTSPFETPPNRPLKYPQQSRVARLSPKSPGKVPKRAATTRVRKDRAQRRASTNLKRQLSLDPLKFHPTNNSKVPTSVPLAVVDRNVRSRATEGSNTTPTGEDGASGEAISGKLIAMLAATDALKPTPQQTNSSSSRLTRMVPPKVLAKVSNAWERFHPKTLSQEKGPLYKLVVDAGEGTGLDKHKACPASESPDNMSPISNIEIRLNEGDNLNKRKVQRIVGGRVNRKPLADDGKSLRIGKPPEDPFSEQDGWHTPTSFEHRLKAGPDKEETQRIALPRSPFDSEKEFDSNVEDRFLNSTPVGSSTPRIIIERESASSDEYSPTIDDISPSQRRLGVKLSQTSLQSDRGNSSPNNLDRPPIVDPSEAALIDSVSQARRAWERSTRGFASFGTKRTKKHPSPSKEVLEDLERELRQYAHEQASRAGRHGLNELNVGYLDESHLRPQERKSLSLTHLTITNLDELVYPVYDGARHRRGSSASMLKFTSPGEVKLQKDIRLAPAYRPAGSSPHDVDELHC